MSELERIGDIFKTGMFNASEIKKNPNNNPNSFTSWEYYEITHFTNEELYYLADETRAQFSQLADQEEETENGIIFCFK